MPDYRSTLNLPKTGFPMRGNLPQQEPERLKRWHALRVYGQLMERPAERTFVLHDGPPYANGNIHIGHVLNKTLKDIVIRYQTMQGAQAPYVPGWDCHGMPIEHQLLKDLGKTKHEVDRVDFRRQAEQFAQKFVDIQRAQFQRLGILGDWDHPYLTMAREYEVAIVHAFRELLLQGYIYRALKPVFWCWSCETALAEAEVEYREKSSPSVFVCFPVVGQPTESVASWTTTPWTLPANRAVCVHPAHPYALVDIAPEQRIWIATALVPRVTKLLGIAQATIVRETTGRELTKLTVQPPFSDTAVPVVTDDSVSLEEGTGVVHIAPGHGEADYIIGKRAGLEIFSPVDAAGRFRHEAPAAYRNMRVFEANASILKDLTQRQRLLCQLTVQHSYPHCWRCQQPIIFRATAQWFVNIDHDDLRAKLLATIQQVQWHPAAGQARMHSMLETRPDWCLSRQRLWGVPIPVLSCSACDEPLRDERFFDHLEALVRQHGTNVWFEQSADALVPSGAQCPCGAAGEWIKEEDILDVWLDSGVSHEAVLKTRDDLAWPADLYLEGSDQHRGWFQSSLIPSVALHGRAPYEAILTHGFVVDGAGRKMSKSAGNVMAPEEVLTRYGADILRWWVASCDYTEDIRLSPEILDRMAESYRKVRNTLRFLLGNVADFDPAQHRVPATLYSELDRWAWSRCQQCLAEATRSYQTYAFAHVVRAVNTFCVVDLSSVYLDAVKDCLYTQSAHATERRAVQSVLYDILGVILRVVAPILVFTADEAWEHVPAKNEPATAAQLLRWPDAHTSPEAEGFGQRWDELLQLRAEVLKALEEARAAGCIGGALEAKVTLAVPAADVQRLTSIREMLTILSIVSALDIVPGTHGRQVQVSRADGRKCSRCWMMRVSVGADAEHPELCERCVGAVRSVS